MGFIYQTNKYALFDKREFVLRNLEPVFKTTNKHTKVALTTILLNIAIVLHESTAPPKPWDVESAKTITRLALGFLNSAGPEDADAQQRACLAIGTLLPRDRQNGGPVKAQCIEANLPTKLIDLQSKVGSNYTAELRMLLG